MAERESFEVAVTRFAKFLGAEGCPEKILWVWPEDLLLTGKRLIYVRAPLSKGNADRVKTLYEEEVGLDRSARMAVACVGDDATYCYVWKRPEDPTKAPQGLPARGLMMSVKQESSRAKAKPVRNKLRWKWLRWRNREKQEMKELLFS